MAGPESFDAQIEIALLRLEDIGELVAEAETAFVRARIGTKAFGRSRRVRKGVSSFSLKLEPMPWSTEVRVTGSTAVTGWVQILADQWDSPPVLLAELPFAVTSDERGEVTFGNGPTLVLHARPRFCPRKPRVAFVPRVADGSPETTHAKLVSRPTVAVTITAVHGLYRPLEVDHLGGQATYVPGYKSDDQRGRIFLNRDLDGTWKKGHQAIELEATIEVLAGRLPPDAKLVWTLHPEDDPLDDALEMHQQWGPVLDPADYDADGTPTGASGSDIRGVPSQTPPWQEVEPYSLHAASDAQATTTIVENKSRVLFLCPDEAGDVFSISATLPESRSLEVLADQTGLLTMWNRFDVEYVRMDTAVSLKKCLRRVALAFEAANIQMRFSEERVVPTKFDYGFWRHGPQAQVLPELKKRFTRHEEPGWLFLMALEDETSPNDHKAETAVSPPPLASLVLQAKLFESSTEGTSGGLAKLQFAAPPELQIDEARYVVVHHNDLRLYFLLGESEAPADGFARYTLVHMELIEKWSADTRGAVDPFSFLSLRADRLGVPLNEPVRIEVFWPSKEWDEVGEVAVSIGFSPLINRHWWGAALLKRGGPDEQNDHFIDSKARDIVHELVHGLGLHHGCGFHDWRTPRVATCACNYDAHALWPGVVAGETPVIGPPDQLTVSGIRRREHLCGVHIRELRRSKFHLHPGFRWKQ